MPTLPRGASDRHDRRAVVHDRHGTLIALRLADGAELWRHGRGLRALAVLDRRVVALRVDGEPVPSAALVVLDAEDGAEHWTSPPLRLPDWARPTLHDSDTFTARTETVGDGVLLLHWTARLPYTGGASPDRTRLPEPARAARGTVRLDLTGEPPTTSDPGPDPSAAEASDPQPAEPPEPPEPPESLAPDVVQAARLGDLRMELAVRPHTGAVLLRAVDLRTRTARWEVELDPASPRHPPRLRP